MTEELWRGTCPACNAEVVYERFGDSFACSCGARLEPMHDCAYDEESDLECCHDWLAVLPT